MCYSQDYLQMDAKSMEREKDIILYFVFFSIIYVSYTISIKPGMNTDG